MPVLRSGELAQVFYGDGQIFGPGSSNGHGLVCHRVVQFQLFGMEGYASQQWPLFFAGFEAVVGFQAREPEGFAAVKLVANDWDTGVAQVNAYLMGAAGEWFAKDEGVIREFFQDGEFRF